MENLYCWQSKFKTCKYSELLLNKISSLNEQTTNKVDIIQIKKAIYYAKKYHGNQKRDTGEPFYNHPLIVAFMTVDFCFKTDIIVTSILHDTIEDTCLTQEKIAYIFDANIASQVYCLTRIKDNKKIPASQLLESLWLQNKTELLIIKCLDRLHNIQSILVKTTLKIKKTVQETMTYFLAAVIILKQKNLYFTKIENELISLCVKAINYIDLSRPPDHQQNSFADDFRLESPTFQNIRSQNSFLHK